MHFQANAQALLCEYIGAMDVYRSDMDALGTEYISMHLIFLLLSLRNIRTDITYQEFEEKPHVLV